MRMMRAAYDRIGDRADDVEAYVPIIRDGIRMGFIVIDHPGVSLLRSTAVVVTFGVESDYTGHDDAPLGPLSVNVPALGCLVGRVARASDGGGAGFVFVGRL